MNTDIFPDECWCLENAVPLRDGFDPVRHLRTNALACG